jgi:hypothetical protein
MGNRLHRSQSSQACTTAESVCSAAGSEVAGNEAYKNVSPLPQYRQCRAKQLGFPGCADALTSLNLYFLTSWGRSPWSNFFETPDDRQFQAHRAAIEAHYRFVVWLVPTIEKFPKSHKFTIGDRIEISALDVLDALIEAAYTKDRTQQLCCGAWHELFGKRPRWEIWTRPIGRGINAALATDSCQ